MGDRPSFSCALPRCSVRNFDSGIFDGKAVGRDAEQAPAVGVEDRREDARRVEARAAVPVDRPVGADQRDGMQIADQAVLGDGQVARARRPPDATGHDPLRASTEILCHYEPPLSGYGTSTSFPVAADFSSSSCARRASVSGRRSATTGWILSARSSSSSAAKSSRNHSV
jgi:hypothetical protein